MRKYVYRTLAIAMTFCTIVSLESLFAEPATVSGSDVNVRSGPDSSYGVTDCLALNTAVEITDRSNSSWYQISYNGKTGYMYSKYLKTSDNSSGSSLIIGNGQGSSPAATGTKGTINAMYVRFRSSPNTDSSILGTYNRGQSVTVTGDISNGWYPAVINGQSGYVYAQYVDVQSTSTPVSTPVPSAAPSAAPETPVTTPVVAPVGGTEGYITGDDVLFRSGPGTNYAVRGAYNKGTKVTIKGQLNGWTNVILNDMEGYIFSQYISTGSPDGNTGNTGNTGVIILTPAPESTPAPVATPVPTAAPVTIKAYVTGNSVNFRSGPGVNFSILGSYDKGQEVEYKGENNGWTSVSINGRDGYVSSQYISRTNPNNSQQSGNSSTVPAATPAPVTTTKAYITGNEVNFRTGPGTNYTIITTFNRGSEVEFIDESNGWSHIKYNNSTGYVSSQYVNKAPSSSSSTVTPVQPTPSPVPTPGPSAPVVTPAPTQNGFIKGNSVRFRSGPSTASDIYGVYNYGKTLTVKDDSGEWVLCTIDGRDGYVYKTYVAKDNVTNAGSSTGSSTTPGQIPSNVSGNDIVNYAMEYVGYPYVWGGTTPAGFDCSGFVQYVYYHFGYSLKRVASDQATDGIFVQGDLMPGDILCFYSGSNYIGHVGIYIGNGQFVHASNSTTGVIVSDLSGYYTNRGYVARRIIY